ncbi:MAG: TIGR00730 family Rossman fold protein, partial [Burkholderiales bacterium]
LMADLSGAFIALPGGFGTLDEFFEILTWAQLGIHSKPCGLLNVDGYFDSLLAFLDRAVQEGLLQQRNRSLFTVARDPSALIRELEQRSRGSSGAKVDVR